MKIDYIKHKEFIPYDINIRVETQQDNDHLYRIIRNDKELASIPTKWSNDLIDILIENRVL